MQKRNVGSRMVPAIRAERSRQRLANTTIRAPKLHGRRGCRIVALAVDFVAPRGMAARSRTLRMSDAMEYRALGRTGWKISPISYGAWAIGGDAWGKTDDAESMRSLHRAVDLGVNFIDTADVYGNGHSEKLIGRLLRERSEEIIVATKAGRRLRPHVAAGFTRENLSAFVERSIKNLDTEALDLLQLHCPPPNVYDMPEVFGILDDLVQAGKLRYYGVSVETVD